jgi:ABC-2 type transport system ATP-binding protein
MPEAAIYVENLRKVYSTVVAVDNLSFEVPRGQIFGLLGPNGAGKTTLVRQLTGELLPTSGSIDVLGVDVIEEPLRAKALMGVVPQEALPFEAVATEQHLRIFARLHGLSISRANERAEELLRALDLLPHRTRRAIQLSGGLRRKLLVGMALVAQPPLVVLDEPTTGLDPRSRREVWSLISSLRVQGATVLLTTHYMDEAEELCNEVAIIGEGHILARGTVEQVRSRCRNQFKATFLDNGERRTVYGRTQHEVAAHLADLDLVEYAVSKTSLEDIYLELTGETVEEAELAASVPQSWRAQQ